MDHRQSEAGARPNPPRREQRSERAKPSHRPIWNEPCAVKQPVLLEASDQKCRFVGIDPARCAFLPARRLPSNLNRLIVEL